jgi:hypothetical protein
MLDEQQQATADSSSRFPCNPSRRPPQQLRLRSLMLREEERPLEEVDSVNACSDTLTAFAIIL